jgi:cytidyltransferase-like protein
MSNEILNNEQHVYDRIYTIGCFDWFHDGHRNLLNKMKNMGKVVIAGVHDDESIEQLKNLHKDEHQDVTTRMTNVKTLADIVYIIPTRDPSFYLESMIRLDDNKHNACFVRADDNLNFPGKHIVNDKIDLIFLPYTKGISSTQIRKNMKNDK